MDALYSIDEVSDNFWPSPATDPSIIPDLSRSSSDWALQSFLEEVWKPEEQPEDDVVEIVTPLHHHHHLLLPSDQPPISSDDPQAPLKRRLQLDLACAAFARTRESSVRSQESACMSDNQSRPMLSSQLGSQVIGPWNQFPISKLKADGELLSVPVKPDLQKISGMPTQAASGSSRDQSDDDELEEETETTENMEPTDVKRVRRKLSNRESAKRSRRRKQEHLSELETQVALLRTEKSSLSKLHSEWDRKYNDAAVDNRVLKADIETLRAKVMMVEDKVKRVTGLNALQPLSDLPGTGVSFGSNTIANATGSQHPDSTHLNRQQAPTPLHYRLKTGFPINPTSQ